VCTLLWHTHSPLSLRLLVANFLLFIILLEHNEYSNDRITILVVETSTIFIIGHNFSVYVREYIEHEAMISKKVQQALVAVRGDFLWFRNCR
jgi:hypothetical protein